MRRNAVSQRPATTDDRDFAWQLYRATMKPLTAALLAWDDAAQLRTITDELASGKASIILEADRPIGWLLVDEDEAAVALGQIYLVADARNRGIGTTIVRDLIAAAHDRGKPVRLSVMQNNPARRLYQRLGFVETGTSGVKVHMSTRIDDGG